VAVLVASGAKRQSVLEAITTEAFTLFPVDFTALLEYEPDGAAVLVAIQHGPLDLFIGERAPSVPDGLVGRVLRSLRPAAWTTTANLRAWVWLGCGN
jgi:hypothetical protein